jgi:hypothetical protein
MAVLHSTRARYAVRADGGVAGGAARQVHSFRAQMGYRCKRANIVLQHGVTVNTYRAALCLLRIFLSAFCAARHLRSRPRSEVERRPAGATWFEQSRRRAESSLAQSAVHS